MFFYVLREFLEMALIHLALSPQTPDVSRKTHDIPQIILAEQKNKKGKFIVIDGKQRLLSIQQFVLPTQGEKPL